jgi:putative nucleotidyltransferase with HDIG domain
MSFIKKILVYRKRIQVIFLYIVSIALVFVMYPREGKFQYEYVKNTPWLHQDLIAPFDFPIHKDEAQLERERDSITRNSLPYFTLDTTVRLNALAALREDISNTFSGQVSLPFVQSLRSRINDTLPGLLKEVYGKGIVELHPVLNEESPTGKNFMAVRKQVAEQTTLDDVLTEKQAYEYIMKNLTSYTRRSPDQVLSTVSLTEYILPNLLYNASMTQNILNAKLEEVGTTQGMVQAGQIIISRGELVSPAKFRIVESLRKEYETNPNVFRNYTLIYFGQLILISILFLSLLWYVANFRKDLMNSFAQTMFLLSMILVMVALTKVTVNNESISYYLIPFAIVPIFLKTFFNVRFALFVHFLILLLAGFWIPNSYQFMLMNFLAGVVAVFSMRSYYRRSVLMFIATFVSLTYILIYLILSLLQEGNFEGVDWTQLLWFAGNGLLILTVYPLVYLFERLFGFLSDATLFELSDTNQPLLRKLSEKTPGTFQHCMQVANLAEEAILKIGGNPLLVRAGALYHDIGKMENPQYFIENLREGENPHNQHDFKTSARIIIDHVTKGVEIAKKHNLPPLIIDFILTHHGTTTVQYFYRSYLNTNPDDEVSLEDFKYPGPKPYRKEMVAVMIADAVEAASRSMKEISADSIDKLVDQIIDYQARQGQYEESDITFGDLNEIKKIYKEKLRNIYHARIEYPEEK